MRLLQIDPNGSETTALDFHPMVTVVTGLTPSGRDIVLRVARSLAKAQDPGYGGLIEAHGVLLDLSRDTLELLDLQSDVDVMVSDADLPAGAPLDAAADAEPVIDLSDTAETSGAPRTYDDVQRFIREAPSGLSEEFDQARRRGADSQEALGILREAFEKAQVEFDKVLTKMKIAEAELAAARDASGPILRLVVNDDAAEGEEPREPEIDPVEIIRQRDELTAKIEATEQRIANINRGLEELSTIDTRPLTVLLEAINNPQPIEYVPSERAHELADEVVDLERKVANLEKELDKRGLASGAALKQMEVARMELAGAEKAMTKPESTPDDIAELEAVHEEVLELSGKKRAGKRLEQALAKQQEILDRIGFPTWSAYVMGAGLLAIDHAAEQRLERARMDLEAAESHWASVVEEIEANPEHRRLLDRLEDVYLEAFDLLGGAEPDDLEASLRELQVPKREVTTDELVDALSYQLELVGLQLPDGAGADLTVMAAEAFIEEVSAVEGRIAELRDERATCDAELSVARGQLNDLPEVELPEPEPEAEPEPFEPFAPDAAFDLTDADDRGEGAAQRPAQTGFDAFDPSDPFGLGEPTAEDADESIDAVPGDGEPLEIDRNATPGPDLDLDVVPTDGGGVFGAPEDLAPSDAAGVDPDADLEHLERAVEVAREEVDEYTEWVESRQALVDAALTVETVSASRLMKIASELMDELETQPGGGPLALGDDFDPGNGSMSDAVIGGNGSSAPTGPARPEDVESYLSSRLDAQRHLSYAGSVPLVLNDTLQRLEPNDVRRVLDHLQNVSETVQVIYLTDDARVAGWAEEVGFQRAAVVPAPIGFG